MDLYLQAVHKFQSWYDRALACGLREPTAMSLATVNAGGQPSVRTVLLKHVDADGFVFYTNAHSRKGMQLDANPKAALCFFWQPLMQQVLVEGVVQSVAAAESDVYWATRPRQSQLGAWASRQSCPLSGRAELEQRYADYEKQFNGQAVPRPEYWHGFRLVPDMLEFWVSRPGRLHERERYYREQRAWKRTLLYP